MIKLDKIRQKVAGFVPTALPVGKEEFNKFCASIFYTYDLPALPSYKHAIASMIMHLGPTKAKATKRFFALSVKKAMSNQVAYEIIQDLKNEEAAYIEATMAKPVATTSSQEGIANDESVSVQH